MKTKKEANRREKQLAKSLKLKQTKNSGATPFDKGDLKDSKNMYDIKSTDKKSISVTKDMWLKLQGQAYGEGLNPILILDYKKYNIKLKVELMEE